jgi:hypothetical protein
MIISRNNVKILANEEQETPGLEARPGVSLAAF